MGQPQLNGRLRRAQFVYDGQADLTGVFEAVLDSRARSRAEDGGSVIVDHVRLHHHANVSPGLHGEA